MNLHKILFCSDTHLGFDYPIRPRIKRRRRGIDFFQNFDFILQKAVTEKVDILIHGGDLFFRSKIPAKIIDITYEKLYKIAEKNIQIIIIPGNHERSILPQSILLNHPNIHIAIEPQVFHFPFSNMSISVTGIPFIRSHLKEIFSDMIKKLRSEIFHEHFNILCLHQLVEDSRVQNHVFRSGENILPKSIFPDYFDLVLSGHIHRQQILQLSNSKLFYAGSVERTSFREMDEAKGFFIFHLDRKSYQFKFLVLPTRQMVVLKVPDEIKTISQLRNWLQNQAEKIDKDAVVKIEARFLHIPITEIRKWVPETMYIVISNPISK